MRDIEIEIVHDRILSAIICTNVNPKKKDAFELIDKALLNIPNGTLSSPWKTLKPTNKMYDNHSKPCKCAERNGYWHYVVIC